ncbi:MAG: TIGR01777 family oxidoreductase [Candidatus Eisenbacteria bacterium]
MTDGAHRPRVFAVGGASGLIGSALVRAIEERGDRALRLVRRKPAGDVNEVYWNPRSGEIDGKALEGVDAVVNLAGESLASGRWTEARMTAIRESRVKGTGLLAETLASLERKPRVFVSASAVGYYGDRGDGIVTEESTRGTGFLAEVCAAWERAADPARKAGIRVVHPRTGVVLTPKGGAVAKMLLPFRLGLGGPIGSGRQYMSCIGLADLVRVLLFLADREGADGPWNAVLPEAVTNADFTRSLAAALGRPAFFRVPAFAISLLFGRMGRETLLASTRARPTRLIEAGFEFLHGDLDETLRAELGT